MAETERQRERLEQVRKDFEVTYRFYSPEEGGRKSGPPAQLYRSDWSYDGDDIAETGIYMIWPIFLDQNGSIIDPDVFVPSQGIAQMFIVNEEVRESVHARRLRPGVRGYLMEGDKRVAEAVVTRLLELSDAAIR